MNKMTIRTSSKWLILIDNEIVDSGNKNEMEEKLSRVREKYPDKVPFVIKESMRAGMDIRMICVRNNNPFCREE